MAVDNSFGAADGFLRKRAPELWGCPAPSVAVTALGPEYDDVYLNQLPLSYNGHPVYVGHRLGRYLFYYEPPAANLPGCGQAASPSPEPCLCLRVPMLHQGSVQLKKLSAENWMGAQPFRIGQ